MQVVQSIFRMIGEEHATLYKTKRGLERAGLPTPGGGKLWHAKVLRNYILDEVYKPHTHAEMMALVDAGQMSASVATRLDPNA
jgi:hypothetical protein